MGLKETCALTADESAAGLLDPDEVGRALEGCRQYLTLMASRTIGDDLRAKEAVSDIVQESICEGYRDFARFRGGTDDELRAWLYCILRNNLLNLVERYRGTAKRRIDREVSLDRDSTAGRAAGGLAARTPSPSQHAIRREQARALERALERVSPKERQILSWRHQDQLTFEEIGRRLGSSAEAARKAWARSVDRLRWYVEHVGDAGGVTNGDPQ